MDQEHGKYFSPHLALTPSQAFAGPLSDGPSASTTFSVDTWTDRESIGGNTTTPSPSRESTSEVLVDKPGFFPALDLAYQKTLVQSCYMAIFAILGALLRILLAQLFGEECANPGTVGWLAAGSPLCVTKDGNAFQEGGIIFADLPANLFGSFIMGMMQSTTAMGLPLASSIAWLSHDSWFQRYDILHLAIRTGFCGSLTTFSSWNSEMVVMMFGSGSGTTTLSLLFRALFGYVIGVETALGSFAFGRKFAEWWYRLFNTSRYEESHALLDKQENGMYINVDLPPFERRFLHHIDNVHWNSSSNLEDLERQEFLHRWRTSVEHARYTHHPDCEVLVHIENALLVDRKVVLHRHEAYAVERNWDLEALKKWASALPPKPQQVPEANDHILMSPVASLLIVGFLYTVLLGLLLFIDDYSAYATTYKTMVYALALAPPGALLRWRLSSLNGNLAGSLSWFPLGTFVANIVGSIVSIAMVTLELVTRRNGFWVIASMRAIKVGFAGSLTTVSTFVNEASSFIKDRKNSDRGYIYMTLSLVVACLLASITYAGIYFTMYQ